jgi:thioredoxin reductase (NADPH)
MTVGEAPRIQPSVSWIARSGIKLDERGFVLTGVEAGGRHQFETSCEGVFAIGDARCGSVKRVAAAVGESAQCR